MAVADASFKILILSISLGFKKLSGFFAGFPPRPITFPPAVVAPPDKGIPSTTNNGLLLDLTELEPLIRILTPAPGAPLVLEI